MSFSADSAKLNADPEVENAPTAEEDQLKHGWPEPFPKWTEAIREWNWMWYAHIYGFGSLFALITLFAIGYLFWFRRSVLSEWKVHRLVMTSLLIVTNFGRSFCLLWDPYGSRGTRTSVQTLLTITSWGTALACLTSAFSIMLLIFLETTKTKFGPPKLRNLPFLVSVTLVNIVFLIVSDLVVWFHPEAKVMIFVCHVTFAAWGLGISVGYFIACVRMWRNLKPSLRTPSVSDRCLLRDIQKLKRLFFFMCTASLFGLSTFSVSIYISVGEFGVFSEASNAKIWSWFAIESTLRSLEILLSALIFLIAVKNQKACKSRSNEGSKS